MTTTVVNVHKIRGVRPPYDVYIGRQERGFKRSKWANPFKIDKPGRPLDGSRDEVIEKYRAYLLAWPDLLADLGSLRGKRLGCWCAPLRGLTAADPVVCHGQVLAQLIDEMAATSACHGDVLAELADS